MTVTVVNRDALLRRAQARDDVIEHVASCLECGQRLGIIPVPLNREALCDFGRVLVDAARSEGAVV